ncbi:secretin N-terminal domain-containing protein [Hyphomonas sp. FCG-A18]|uniref:secretin N-terminal domain-containing protein n=1 Tax=Hyphomonas sp. FCG-A18 TaxID=3080019 RepID=UPI002B2A4289|nr:secretin N-terminal domain-containing protein [Hyphomonas sp. FCG-A18]
MAAVTIVTSCGSTDLRHSNPLGNDNGVVELERSKDNAQAGPISLGEGGAVASNPDSPEETFDVPTLAQIPDLEGGFDPQAAPKSPVSIIDASVRELPLPDFIDSVFGNMLQVPYFTGPGVAQRADVIVKLRTSGDLAADDFLELVTDALKEYGVAVVPEDGVYKLVEDETLRSRMPRFIRSRAVSDTPSELRPLVMFIELDAMSAADMASILRQAFPDAKRLKIEPNQRINVLVLTGLPQDVEAAISIIEQMDELAYAGTDLVRYSPKYVIAGDLASQLSSMLAVEGWQASSNPSVQRTVVAIPVEFTNDLFVFSKSPAALARTRFWLNQLDRPAKTGDVPQLFVYAVQNVDATLLSETVNRVLSGGGGDPYGTPAGATQAGLSGSAGIPPQSGGFGNSAGGVVVDPISNRLIFSGTAADYERLLPLLQQLDRPPGEVLISVMIAEVSLTDETRYGFEFFIDSIGNDDVTISGGTSNLAGSDGLAIGILSGNVEIALNAFARNNQVNVLSRPKLVARSGSAAQLQVGTDVPVITSQRAAGAQDGDGVTDVLQSVEYRKTGVLLSIEPIVFSDNRVDLTISQEVSTVIPDAGSQIASPTISNRNLQTQLSIQDGETVVLGGLMQTTSTDAERGVPLLKDIPIAGNLFRNNSISQEKTELLVLITAYILNDGEDKAMLVNQLMEELQNSTLSSENMQTLLRPRRDQDPAELPGYGLNYDNLDFSEIDSLLEQPLALAEPTPPVEEDVVESTEDAQGGMPTDTPETTELAELVDSGE